MTLFDQQAKSQILFDYELTELLFSGKISLLGDMWYNVEKEAYTLPVREGDMVYCVDLLLKQDYRYLWE